MEKIRYWLFKKLFKPCYCFDCESAKNLITEKVILKSQNDDLKNYWTPERATGALAYYLVMTYGYNESVKLTNVPNL